MATLDQLQLELSALRAEFNRQYRPAIQALLNEANNGATRDQIYDRYQSLYAAVVSTSKQLNRIKSDADAIRSQFGVPDFIATVDDVASRIPLQQTDLDTALSTATRNTNTDTSTSQSASGGTSTTPQTLGAASSANPDNANTAAGGNPIPTNTVVSPLRGTENESAAETARLNRQARAAASPGGTENQSAAETARLNRQAGAILPNAIANPNNAATTAGFNQTAGSNDDASPSMSQTTRSAAAAAANSLGIDTGPLPNPLDKYPSYTYNLGLYILTPEEYNTLVESPTTSETISFPGDQLLIRSGGGPVGQGKRNPYFSDCDFVLDNLKIDAVIGFSEQGIPSSVGRLSFTVTEPVGATFIYRLQSATADLANRDPNSANQYFNHTYALVIRFYGYDNNGNPITPKGDVNQLDQAGSSESAVTTKIFLFMLSDIKTRIGARVVEYQMQGIFSSSMPARTAMLGVSPTHYTVTGANLNDIFNGVPGTTNASSTEDDPRSETTAIAAGVNQSAAAPTATAQSSQNVPVKGLCQAINSTLYRLANPQGQEVKSIEIPDEYEVLFASEKLRSAKVLIPDVDNSLQTSAGSATTGPASTKAENTRKNTSVSKYAKNFQIQEGQQIIQWLDMMIRNCDYIKNQAAFTIKESADADIQGDEDFYGRKLTSQTPVRWYKITPFNKILGYDRLRKTYAQKIIYVISDYQVTSVRSPYFQRAPWRGPDKLYNFTFTGQNTSILNYEQEFNALYIETFGFGASLDLDPAKQKAQASGQVGPSFAFRVVAGAAKQGSLGQATDPSARAAAGLYSFTDLAKVKLKIIGDPDLLLQDWYNVNQALINRQNLTASPGGNDSNVLNSNHGQLYFQVTFLTGDDYNLNEGIVKVEPQAGFVRRQSNAYELTKIVSEFQNGRFTQDIHGLILADVNPDQSFVDGDYTTGAAGQTATGAPVDQNTDTDSSTARQETTQTSQETGAFDTDGSNDLRTQEGGFSSVPQSPTGALPAPPPPFSSPLAARLQELGVQRDQFRRGLLPNQAQVGNDDAPPDVPYG